MEKEVIATVMRPPGFSRAAAAGSQRQYFEEL